MNFARLNIKIASSFDFEEIAAKIEAYLNNAALEGCGDEFETFSNSSERVVGLNIPFSDELSLLEAGSVFGYCMAAYENDEVEGIEGNWMSIHADDDSLLARP
jgi:hypothetical protein